MAPRSILITGADGFVGRHLQPALRRRFPNATLHCAGFDVTDRVAVQQAVRDSRPDACVHLAAVAAIPLAQSEPRHCWDVNLAGTLNLAWSILDDAPHCHLVFVSSADAYGRSFQSGEGLDESAALAPLNTYGATKAAADLALGSMVADGLRVIRMRPFNHTGPGQSDQFVIAAFARQIMRIKAGKQPPSLEVGALDPLRDFLDVRDVVEAYAAAIERRCEIEPGSIFNLASGKPRKIEEILRSLIDLAGVEVTIVQDPARLRAVDIPIAWGDASRARRLLNWTPMIPWEQTLRDTLESWREA